MNHDWILLIGCFTLGFFIMGFAHGVVSLLLGTFALSVLGLAILFRIHAHLRKQRERSLREAVAY